MINLIWRSLIYIRMQITLWLLWKPFIKKTCNPGLVQRALLRSILKQNENTIFGRDHSFANISSYEDYKNAVPVHEYEGLRLYIEKQEAEKTPYLTIEQPVMYALTSGSTGAPKYIPVLKGMLSQYRKSQKLVAYALYKSIPNAYQGKILAITSPATEGHLSNGTPYGSMSGLIYESMPTSMRTKYVVPPEIFGLNNYEQKYDLIIERALLERDITIIATANPSTIVKLEKIMNSRPHAFIEKIRTLVPARAKALEQLLKQKGAFILSDIWPDLKAVVTWKGGSCGVLCPIVQKMLAPSTKLIEMGYLSSEFRGTINVDPLYDTEVLTVHENFFEFVEIEDWHHGKPAFLLIDQLRVNQRYYIFVTTFGGLYRYNMNDIIEVTGQFNKSPAIRFIQKGKGVTNLTGEKLYEGQLVEAMLKLQQENDLAIRFFIMLGCEKSLTYTLFIEHACVNASQVEQYLKSINIEFNEKCKSGRLKPIQIVFVADGTGKAYEEYCLKDGKREGQYKLSYLHYKKDCPFNFMAYARNALDATERTHP